MERNEHLEREEMDEEAEADFMDLLELTNPLTAAEIKVIFELTMIEGA